MAFNLDISIFEPREMIGVLRQVKKPSTFILDTFFKSVKQHSTDKLDIDIVDKTGRKMAPYVSPMYAGKVMKHEGYTTKTITPPYIKILTTTTAGEAAARQPGETLYEAETSPAIRAAQILGEDLKEVQDQIMRRLEWNACELMNSGEVTMTGEGISINVDFGMKPTHKVTLEDLDAWNQSGSDPIEDLETWAELVGQDSGIYPDVVIVGKTAAAAFRSNAAVKNYLDVRRLDVGSMKPRFVAPGVKFLMYVESAGLEVYQYSESYYDEATQATRTFIPDDAVWVGSTQAMTGQHYGLIKDLEVGDAAVKVYAKTWIEKNPSQQSLLVQSAPIVAMHQPDAFLRATVIDTVVSTGT